MGSNESTHHSFNWFLVEVSKRLVESFDCEVRRPQRGIRDAAPVAAERTHNSFVSAQRAIGERWLVIVGCAACTTELAEIVVFLSRTVDLYVKNNASRNTVSPSSVPRTCSRPNLFKAHDFEIIQEVKLKVLIDLKFIVRK